MLGRRELIWTGLVAAAAAILAPRSARAATSRIDVLLDEPIGPVTADFYGHFVEHLGGVVYDGIWVGEGSRIPNEQGVRRALIEHMRRLPRGAIRWPGGCFADSYDWRDGVGPRNARPTRPNFWIDERAMLKRPDGPAKHEPNWFGTHEFIRLCRQVGAPPYLAANLRSLPARDFYQWVEYCNSPAGKSTLADQRAAVGDREPFGVRFWGVGNESWGCGGEFTAEEYATEYRRFTAWVPRYGHDLSLIASGPNGGDLTWTRRFFTRLLEKGQGQLDRLWGWALHHYSWNVSRGRTTDWYEGKGDAVSFTTDEWYELLNEADRMEGLITSHWNVMGEFDRTHRVKLVVDEWGAWHREGTEVAPHHLFGQQSTMRDALLAALTLDTFHRHADKVAMTNVAQLINCLHALFLADGDRFVATPTFHVFEMYGAHVGGRAVRTLFSAPRVTYARQNGPASFWGLGGSATVKERTLTLTVVNPHVTEPSVAEIALRGGSVKSVRASVIAASDIHAHNTFDRPDTVRQRDGSSGSASGSMIAHTFPPASVTRLTIELG